MIIHGINYPQELLDAFTKDSVVIFAGAGVSKYRPSNLPLFNELAIKIAEGTGLTPQPNQPLDFFLGKISHRGINVNEAAATFLKTSRYNDLHVAILSMFSDPSKIKIITTNLDLLFEKCANAKKITIPRVFSAPAMPLGKNFSGLVHLHGDIKHCDDAVLDVAAFGKAYMTEGWASRFMVDICQHYTTLFIGYSHNDTIMEYFSRAVPRNGYCNRYILTDDDEKDWKALGIEPILFKKEDWDLQKQSLNELSNTLHHDYFVWEDKLRKILTQLPPNNPEDIDKVNYILTNESRITIFTENTTKVEWLEWLKENRYLEFLLKPNCEFNQIQNHLCGWMIEKFLISDTGAIVEIIGENLPRLHSQAFFHIFSFLTNSPSPIPQKVFKFWLTVLLIGRGFSKNNKRLLLNLIKKSNSENLYSFALVSSLNQDYNFLSEMNRSYELLPDYLNNNIKFDENDIKNKCFDDYRSIIYHCINTIHQWYIIREYNSDEKNQSFDLDSLRINAIEADKPTPVISRAAKLHIRLLRDTMLNLSQVNRKEFFTWIDILVCDKSNLLKRLAIYLMTKSDEAPDKKIDWLTNNIKLVDSYFYHEFHTFLFQIYPNASLKKQRKILKKIQDQVQHNLKELNTNAEAEKTNNIIFYLLTYLKNYAPDDSKITSILATIQKHHPEFQTYTSIDKSQPATSITLSQEDLYRLSPEDFIKKISLDINTNIFDRSDSNQVKEMAVNNIDWAISVMNAAISQNDDVTKMIILIICQVIEDRKPFIEEAPKIVDALFHIPADIDIQIVKNVITTYRNYIKDDIIRTDLDLLDKIRNNIDSIWDQLPRIPITTPQGSEWVIEAMNNTLGMIVHFYIDDLSKDQQSQILKKNSIPSRYIDFFTQICKDSTVAGEIGQVAIVEHFFWFYFLAPEWVKNTVTPLLKDKNSDRLWEAVFTNFRCKGAYEELLPLFRERISNNWKFENRELQKDFIKKYSAILIIYINNEDFIKKYLPELFNYLNDAEKPLFADEISELLQDDTLKDHIQIWQSKIMPFLKLRIQNKPCTLKFNEISSIIEWAPYLDFVFPKYVELLEKIPDIKISNDNMFIFSLSQESESYKKFDLNSLGRFLLILLNHSDQYNLGIFYGINGLYPKISSEISSEIDKRIRARAKEIQIELGV